MSIGGLDNALSGLRAAQQQLDVIANNVSNASTPGFTRKILPQESQIIGKTMGAGVRTNAVIRNVDLNLARDLWTQVSAVSFAEVQASYVNRIEEFHGAPEAQISISAQIARLKDEFAALADSPENTLQQRSVVDQAKNVSKKINDFANLLNTMRNDAQSDIEISITKVNQKLQQIATLNADIKFNKITGKTTAALEDKRDDAINALTQEMDISFFMRGDGVLVVQTAEGVQLADTQAETIYFKSSPVGESSYYPASAAGIYVGDPDTSPNAINISDSELGGAIGGLLGIRDDIAPIQQAALDELAHKLAQRFDQQGLRLFTNPDGTIPGDTAPNPLTDPPTSVPYVGFARVIQVNPAILRNNTLVQQGTVDTDMPVQSGSNEIINRVLDYTFGANRSKIAQGTVNLNASAATETLQDWLGIRSTNKILGTKDLGSYINIDALIAASPSTFFYTAPGPATSDSFTITFGESRTTPALGPTTVTISLNDAMTDHPIGGAINNAMDQLIAEINDQIAAAPVAAGLAAQASVNGYGQLILTSTGNITIGANGIGQFGQAGLDLLGLTAGVYTTTDPYIEVQVGNDNPVKITIEPGDTEVTLLAKLNKISGADDGVAGLGAAIDAGTGRLTIMPGDSTTNPSFGGNLAIIGGNFTTDGTGTIPGGIVAGTSLIAALFGNSTPVTNVAYGSANSTGGTSSFRTGELGPSATLETGILSSTTLIDYAQKLVNSHAELASELGGQTEDATAFRDLLQSRLLNSSGVNIDEELSNLIVVQTAYSASARIMTAIKEQFDELLRVF